MAGQIDKNAAITKLQQYLNLNGKGITTSDPVRISGGWYIIHYPTSYDSDAVAYIVPDNGDAPCKYRAG